MSDFKISVVGEGDVYGFNGTMELSRLSVSDPQLSESDAIILAGATTSDLVHLRADKATRFPPIFSLDTALAAEALCDGPVPKDLHHVLKKYRQNLAAMAEGAGRSSEHALMRYLWELDNRTLTPERDLNTSRIIALGNQLA